MCKHNARLLKVGTPAFEPLKRDKTGISIFVKQLERIKNRHIPIPHHAVL